MQSAESALHVAKVTVQTWISYLEDPTVDINLYKVVLKEDLQTILSSLKVIKAGMETAKEYIK